MKNTYLNKIENWFNQAVDYLQAKKRQLYKNQNSSLAINILRLIFGAFLLVGAIYAGIKIILYTLFVLVLVIAGYFLFPIGYFQKDFPVIAKKTQEGVNDFAAKAKEDIVIFAEKAKEEIAELTEKAKAGTSQAVNSVKEVISRSSDKVKKETTKEDTTKK